MGEWAVLQGKHGYRAESDSSPYICMSTTLDGLSSLMAELGARLPGAATVAGAEAVDTPAWDPVPPRPSGPPPAPPHWQAILTLRDATWLAGPGGPLGEPAAHPVPVMLEHRGDGIVVMDVWALMCLCAHRGRGRVDARHYYPEIVIGGARYPVKPLGAHAHSWLGRTHSLTAEAMQHSAAVAEEMAALYARLAENIPSHRPELLQAARRARTAAERARRGPAR